MAGGVHHVGHHGGGGGQLASPPAIEHHVADGVALDGDGVEHVLHAGQRILPVQQVGGHIGADPAVVLTDGPTQQLDLFVAGLGVGHVSQGHPGDPLGGHLAGVNVAAEGDGGQNANFPAGVVALHVGGGVGLGIAVGLGLTKRGVKGQARPDHPGENIVGGAVEDTADLGELVGGQALTQGPENRDAAAHAGLEQVAGPLPGCELEQLAAVLGHQLLVGGYHALARAQGPPGKVQRHARAADSLHHDIHLGVVLDGSEVVDDLIAERAVRKISHIQDIFQPHRGLHLLVDVGAVFGQHLRHTGAHGSKPQDRYVHHLFHLVVCIIVPPGSRTAGLPSAGKSG